LVEADELFAEENSLPCTKYIEAGVNCLYFSHGNSFGLELYSIFEDIEGSSQEILI
jgi:hypothetical protein